MMCHGRTVEDRMTNADLLKVYRAHILYLRSDPNRALSLGPSEAEPIF